MELKLGYKRTEVGLIPEDWELLPVSRLGEIKRGASSVCIQYTNFNGVRLIRINDFFEDNPVFVKPTAEIMRFALQERDLLFAGTGASAGASYLPPREWLGLPHSYNAPRIRVFKEYNKEFLLYSLQSDYIRRQQKAWFVGNAQPFLDTKAIANLSVAVPLTKDERDAIAEALSNVDELLAGLDRLITKKRDLKQAAMQELLTGRIRLPGFSGDWEAKTLGDIVEKIVGGGTPSRANSAFWGNEIPWATVKDFATFSPRNTQECITRVGLNSSASNLIPAGTLITSTRMALGKAVVYDVDVAINQDLKALILKPSASVKFLSCWFEYYGRIIDDLGSGSTVKGISVGELKRIPIHLPHISEQTAIAEVLNDMAAELAALDQRQDKTRALKYAMMQELLTGKTRLVPAGAAHA